MVGREDMPPEPEPREIDCTRARVWIEARIAQSVSDVDDALARAHLARCAECRDAYRSQMALGMRLARAAESAAGAATVGAPAPTIGASLRKRRGVLVVVACSIVLFAIARVGRGLRSDPTLPVRWESGAVWVAGEPVGAAFGPRTGLRGDLVETGGDGRVRLQFDTGALHVDPSTTLLVESAVAERVRLVGGAVRIEGDAQLWTPFGIVAVAAGDADVTLADERLAVRTLAGDVRVLTAAGEHVIAVGRGAELEAGRWTDAPAAH
jgi:predicted anti-sigma-YlaC factor YlaD